MRQYCSQAAEEARQLATGKGSLTSLYVVNVAAATRYVWVFDNTASSGTVLCGPFPVAAGQGLALGWPEGDDMNNSQPRYATGLRVASSTSASSFAASGAADFRINATFE